MLNICTYILYLTIDTKMFKPYRSKMSVIDMIYAVKKTGNGPLFYY